MGRMTAAELWDWQAEQGSTAYELDAGELLERPMMEVIHGYVEAEIGFRLHAFIQERGLGKGFLGGVGFILNESTVRAPDVAFLSRGSLQRTPIPEEGFYPGAPDLAVEVLSPRDRAGETLHKIGEWLASGTRLVWVVDPKRRTVAAHRPDAPCKIFTADSVLTAEPVLPGFECQVSELFPSADWT